jgi:hypothetical protein
MQQNPEHTPEAAAVRQKMTRDLAELHKLHLTLASDSQALKQFSNNGNGTIEIWLGYELLEQYLAMTDAFLENMRGRFEARLGVLRRAEPQLEGKPGKADLAPGHTAFWLEFSRLSSVLRRIAKRSEM